MTQPAKRRMFDETNEALHTSASAVDASAAGSVGPVDTGAVSRTPLMLKIVINSAEIASNDELYTICLQGSTTSDFSANVYNLVALPVGATEVNGGAADAAAAIHYVSCDNTWNGTTVCRYIRAYCIVAGTIATGIVYKMYYSGD